MIILNVICLKLSKKQQIIVLSFVDDSNKMKKKMLTKLLFTLCVNIIDYSIQDNLE